MLERVGGKVAIDTLLLAGKAVDTIERAQRCGRGRWLLGRSIAYQLYADHQALPPYVTDQGAALLQIP